MYIIRSSIGNKPAETLQQCTLYKQYLKLFERINIWIFSAKLNIFRRNVQLFSLD